MKIKFHNRQLVFIIGLFFPLQFFAQLPKNATNQNKLPATGISPVKKDSAQHVAVTPMVDVGNAIIKYPLPAFRATKKGIFTPSNQNPVIFSNEEFDDGNNYNAGSGHFIASEDGLYMFNVNFYMTVGELSSDTIFLRMNGKRKETYIFTSADYTDHAIVGISRNSFPFSTLLRLKKNDFINLEYATQWWRAAVDLDKLPPGIMLFSGFKIRD